MLRQSLYFIERSDYIRNFYAKFTQKSDILIKIPAKFFIFARYCGGLKACCGLRSMMYTEDGGSVFDCFSVVADAGGVGAIAVHVGI